PSPQGITIVKFRTDFANRAGVVETISLVREDGAWKVAGIYVS
ncbi:MAG TPA: LuxR family transcriptional regulator, partial [Erythrobacter sp.]|nr:LuxR family transcriptional regulator [Erythrobacter sp.]